MSGFATPLIGMTGADKQIHRIGGHWARCLLGDAVDRRSPRPVSYRGPV